MEEAWETINNVFGKQKKQNLHAKFKHDQNNTITDPKDISNSFNDFLWKSVQNLQQIFKVLGKIL